MCTPPRVHLGGGPSQRCSADMRQVAISGFESGIRVAPSGLPLAIWSDSLFGAEATPLPTAPTTVALEIKHRILLHARWAAGP